MKLRRALMVGIALGSLFGMAFPATAQEYPSKPITLLVPWSPGGANDTIARLLAQKIGPALGQPVVVHNQPGATGSIGASAVAKSAADGYTLLMAALASHAVYVSLNREAPFDLEKDFSPVAIVGSAPLVFVVHPSVKANTLRELISLAKSKPGGLTFASVGQGSSLHLAGEMFQRAAGIKLLHVPYKGGAPAINDLLGGRVDTFIDTILVTNAHIKSGKLRALAVASNERLAALPDVPTAAEAGLKDFEVSLMMGILAPRGTPAPIIAKVNSALKSASAMPDVKNLLLAQGVVATHTTPDQAAKAIHNEIAKWSGIIKEANIKAE